MLRVLCRWTPTGHAQLRSRRAHDLAHLSRHAHADGVCEHHLVGLGGGETARELEDPPRVDGALERAAERGPDGHGRPEPIVVRTRHDALGGLHGLLDGRVLVALVERLRCGEGDVHLVQAGSHQPVVATLVEDETGIDDARPAVDRRDDLLRPRHLRHPCGIDEADCLDARQPGVGEAVDEFGANLRLEDLGIVLEPVARGDVADDDAALAHRTASLLSLSISSDESPSSPP